jgi:hypothetical protein
VAARRQKKGTTGLPRRKLLGTAGLAFGSAAFESGGLAVAQKARPAARAPFEFRSILASFNIAPELAFDRERWAASLKRYAVEGYNTVVWRGPCELSTGHHRLLRFQQFSEARELSPQANEQCIERMKWLFRTAKQHGLRNILYTTNIYYTGAFAKAHGLDRQLPVSPSVTPSHNRKSGSNDYMNGGVRNEITSRYTEWLFAEFPRSYEDLDGFYSRRLARRYRETERYFSAKLSLPD